MQERMLAGLPQSEDLHAALQRWLIGFTISVRRKTADGRAEGIKVSTSGNWETYGIGGFLPLQLLQEAERVHTALTLGLPMALPFLG